MRRHLLLIAALGVFAQSVAGSQTAGADLAAVAALRGERRLVSAAAVTASGAAVATIENPSPFDADRRLRLVIVGGLDGDERSAATVVSAVRWFKTRAPLAVRRAWSVSALPLARPGSDDRSIADASVQHLWRWIAYQAPDVIVDVRASQTTSETVLGA